MVGIIPAESSAMHIAAGLGIQIPEHQIWFNKQTTCITRPFGDIDPGITTMLDYEAGWGR